MKKDLLFAYIALAVVCVIWGTTYLALRIAVLHFPPLLFTALRQVLSGAIIIAATLIINKGGWPSWDHVLRQSIAGFFMISVGNGFVAWGEMYIPSGIAAIICSLMPVTVILINIAIHREEKPNAKILSGVALGLVGIVLIFSENLREFSRPEYIGGILLIFGAVVGWAVGSIWIKKKNNSTNLFMNAGLQMLGGALFLFPISLAFDDYSNISLDPQAVYPFIYLVVFGSIIAYISYSYALRKLPMTIVSLYAYINPLVAVLLGSLVLNEKLNGKILIAFIITIAGIYLVNKGYQQVRKNLRARWQLVEKLMDTAITIREYEPGNQLYFEKFNRQWIEEFFQIEPVDKEVLENPEEHIINHGGTILFAYYGDQVAGTVALKFVRPNVYEFTKMAVDIPFRGKRIGKVLSLAAIDKAKEMKASSIILYSNTVLAPAISLYRSLGFVEVELDGPYKRSNIKMELVL